jgi:CRISPR/Cas system-associated exonuclease Cas4 (RecB family)
MSFSICREAAMIEQQTTAGGWASTLRISKSQIQTYLICPRKFWFEYVVGATPECLPASLPFGRPLHSAVAAFYKSMEETGTKLELDSITQESAAVWEMESAGKLLLFKGNTSVESQVVVGKAPARRCIRGKTDTFSVTLWDLNQWFVAHK